MAKPAHTITVKLNAEALKQWLEKAQGELNQARESIKRLEGTVGTLGNRVKTLETAVVTWKTQAMGKGPTNGDS